MESDTNPTDRSDRPPAETTRETTTKRHTDTDRQGRNGKSEGRIDQRAVTRPPTRTCRAVDVPGEEGTMVPPIPAVRAEKRGSRIVVSYRFLRLPAECRPTRLIVKVNSVDKPTNSSLATVDQVRAAGQVSLPIPPYGPAPYEANVSASAGSVLGSPTTTVPVT
jgi:hypothetical protein